MLDVVLIVSIGLSARLKHVLNQKHSDYSASHPQLSSAPSRHPLSPKHRSLL